MKYLKKFLSAALAAAMLTAAVPAIASASADSAAEDAARRLTESQKYFYNPSGISLASENEYPETFDLRDADLDGSGVKKNYVTPVKDQGFFGTCWGFAATASAETSILTDLGVSYDEWNEVMPWEMDLSEHHLAWFTYKALPEDYGDQGGEGTFFTDPDVSSGDRLNFGGYTQFATALYSAGIGPMPEYQFPYHGKEGNILYLGQEPYAYSPYDDWSLDESDRFGQLYPLEESFLLPSPAQFEYNKAEKTKTYVYNQAGTDAIKEQLMNGRPVTIGFAADTSTAAEKDKHHYINPATWAHYVPLSYEEDSENGETANHAVTIVGWNDSFPKESFFAEPPENGAWIVKNSWGSDENEFPNKGDWGDHGYFYISYYDHTIESPEALDFDVTPDEDASSSYLSFKYDYMPWNYSYRHNVFDEPASMANEFQNDNVDLTVKTLTFYTDSPKTETTFEMYMLGDSSTSPTDGELLASGTKEYPYGGYHRLDLEEPVYIPANAKFSVVVTNKTADGKYEITSQEGCSELDARTDAAIEHHAYPYAKGVVNEGESYIKTTNENNEAEWADWGETIAADNEISMNYLDSVGYIDLLAQTEDALKEYNSAVNNYRESHPDYDGKERPEELQQLYDIWKTNASQLKKMRKTILDGNKDADGELFSNAAFYTKDNFQITVIADAVKRDHILYYDSATSKLYSKMNYETKEFSEPIDFPGAICDGNTLTLTSNFQFVTTAKDGLFIDGNTTLCVPEGEHPSILSAADGFKGDDKLNEYTGIFAADGSTIDIDGSLTVRSGTGTDASGRAILSDGDLTITGEGSLNALCGSTVHDESVEPKIADSIGIYVYGDLNISIANAYFRAGSAFGRSMGIAVDEGHSLTIDDGASVLTESSEDTYTDEDFYCYSTACTAGSYLTIKNNSSLTASATGRKDGDSFGLNIFCGDALGDGTVYNGSITLENNSSLILNADGSDQGFGISGATDMPISVKMDSTCTFIAEGTMKASHYAVLSGVTAISDGGVLTYTKGSDGSTNSYVNADGQIAVKASFYPESAFNITYENSAAAINAPQGNYTVIFAAYDGGALTDVKTEEVNVDETGTASVSLPDDFDSEGKTVKAMLWGSAENMYPLCAAV